LACEAFSGQIAGTDLKSASIEEWVAESMVGRSFLHKMGQLFWTEIAVKYSQCIFQFDQWRFFDHSRIDAFEGFQHVALG